MRFHDDASLIRTDSTALRRCAGARVCQAFGPLAHSAVNAQQNKAPLWRWPQLCRALGLPECAGPDVAGIALDSRRIRPGELFIALPGDPGPRFNASRRSDRDGHDFVQDAFSRGAAGALVSRPLTVDAPLLRVQDTLDGLWALGRARRQALGGEVVAVTGSSGKTTAKNLLGAALDAFTMPGSLNNHLGVPLCLASTPADTSTAVYEIGTSHPGEIAMLSHLAQPTTALVLNVHPAHAEFFTGLDAIRKEKLSIYRGLRVNGHFVVEESLDRSGLPNNLRTSTFGEGQAAYCRLLRCFGDQAAYRLDGRKLHAQVPGGGHHRALTLAAVLCVLHSLGRDIRPACNLPHSLIPAGRGGVSLCAGITLIDDSYNANPASMKAALTSLNNSPGRTIAVLGEMLELGAESAAHHESLAPACAQVDLVAGVGSGMKPLMRKLPKSKRWLWREQADDRLLQTLLADLKDGDLVLVKGSNKVFWAGRFTSRLATALTNR